MTDGMNRPIVTIILATYNGERFLLEQLESLSRQSRRPDRLVLRDDGSTDHSVEIVRAWADQNNIVLQEVIGPRLGPGRSFLKALQTAEPADIYLFCDQDDVWQSCKIERALGLVPWGNCALPALCATRLEVVDAQLNFLSLSRSPKNLSFSSATCESLLTGCTMAFNAAFRRHLVHTLPQDAVMHDWWCYLVATGIKGATLNFDLMPTVRYRQHGGNVLGAGSVGWSALRTQGLRFIGRDSAVRSKQLQEFAKIYAFSLEPQAEAILSKLLSAKCGFVPRLYAALTVPIRRQTFFAALTTRLALLTNRF